MCFRGSRRQTLYLARIQSAMVDLTDVRNQLGLDTARLIQELR